MATGRAPEQVGCCPERPCGLSISDSQVQGFSRACYCPQICITAFTLCTHQSAARASHEPHARHSKAIRRCGRATQMYRLFRARAPCEISKTSQTNRMI